MKNKTKEEFLNTCPATGGVCMNPLCLFGCIEGKTDGCSSKTKKNSGKNTAEGSTTLPN